MLTLYTGTPGTVKILRVKKMLTVQSSRRLYSQHTTVHQRYTGTVKIRAPGTLNAQRAAQLPAWRFCAEGVLSGPAATSL